MSSVRTSVTYVAVYFYIRDESSDSLVSLCIQVFVALISN